MKNIKIVLIFLLIMVVVGTLVACDINDTDLDEVIDLDISCEVDSLTMLLNSTEEINVYLSNTDGNISGYYKVECKNYYSDEYFILSITEVSKTQAKLKIKAKKTGNYELVVSYFVNNQNTGTNSGSKKFSTKISVNVVNATTNVESIYFDNQWVDDSTEDIYLTLGSIVEVNSNRIPSNSNDTLKYTSSNSSVLYPLDDNKFQVVGLGTVCVEVSGQYLGTKDFEVSCTAEDKSLTTKPPKSLDEYLFEQCSSEDSVLTKEQIANITEFEVSQEFGTFPIGIIEALTGLERLTINNYPLEQLKLNGMNNLQEINIVNCKVSNILIDNCGKNSYTSLKLSLSEYAKNPSSLTVSNINNFVFDNKVTNGETYIVKFVDVSNVAIEQVDCAKQMYSLYTENVALSANGKLEFDNMYSIKAVGGSLPEIGFGEGITYVTISSCEIQNNQFDNIERAKYIYLNRTSITFDTLVNSFVSAINLELRYLSLTEMNDRNSITVNSSTLERLHIVSIGGIKSVQIKSNSMKIMTLNGMTALETVIVDGGVVKGSALPSGYTCNFKATSCEALRVLDIQDMGLVKIETCPNIQWLEIQNCSNKDMDLTPYTFLKVAILNSNMLESINAQGSNIAYLEASANPNLASINIKKCGYLHTLIAKSCNLTTIAVEDYYYSMEKLQLPDNNLITLSIIDKMPELMVLDVANNKLNDITKLAGHKKLTELYLGGNNYLNESGNGVDYKGNMSVFTAEFSQQLLRVNLGQNETPSSAVKALLLEKIALMSNVQWLQLYGLGLGNSDLTKLPTASLKFLDVRKNSISYPGETSYIFYYDGNAHGQANDGSYGDSIGDGAKLTFCIDKSNYTWGATNNG